MSNSTQAEPLSLSSLSLDSRKATREHGRALLRRIREGLDLRSAPTLWNEYSLVSLQITRGPRLDIDQTEPALGEWRYFLPGPANEANRCKWPEFMAQFPPIRRQNRDGFHDDRLKGIALARNALSDASTVALHLHLLTQPTGWSPHGGMRAIDLASYWQSTQSYVSGRSQSHGFETDLVWSWPSPDSPCPHPDVPHMMALVTDSARPYSDEVLRSEVKAAIGLIMSQMRGSGRYPGHEVFPALVISIHGRYSARIVQATLSPQGFIMRSSRHIKLRTAVETPDIRLLARWLNSRPVGDTVTPPPYSGPLA